MNPSPLQLERYCITKVQIQAHEDGKIGTSNLLQCSLGVGKAEGEPLRYEVNLNLKLLPPTEGEKACYTGEVEAIGWFRVVDQWPEEKRDLLVETNGPALLLGAIRELVCNITARGPWPMVVLNSFNFVRRKDAPVAAAEPSAKATA